MLISSVEAIRNGTPVACPLSTTPTPSSTMLRLMMRISDM